MNELLLWLSAQSELSAMLLEAGDEAVLSPARRFAPPKELPHTAEVLVERLVQLCFSRFADLHPHLTDATGENPDGAVPEALQLLSAVQNDIVLEAGTVSVSADAKPVDEKGAAVGVAWGSPRQRRYAQLLLDLCSFVVPGVTKLVDEGCAAAAKYDAAAEQKLKTVEPAPSTAQDVAPSSVASAATASAKVPPTPALESGVAIVMRQLVDSPATLLPVLLTVLGSSTSLKNVADFSRVAAQVEGLVSSLNRLTSSNGPLRSLDQSLMNLTAAEQLEVTALTRPVTNVSLTCPHRRLYLKRRTRILAVIMCSGVPSRCQQPLTSCYALIP
jgi:hypothetical protein